MASEEKPELPEKIDASRRLRAMGAALFGATGIITKPSEGSDDSREQGCPTPSRHTGVLDFCRHSERSEE